MVLFQHMHRSPRWLISMPWTNNNHSIHHKNHQVEELAISVVVLLSMHLQLHLSMIHQLRCRNLKCHNRKDGLNLNNTQIHRVSSHHNIKIHKASLNHRFQICKSQELVVSSLSLECPWCLLYINPAHQQVAMKSMTSKQGLMLWKMAAVECENFLSLNNQKKGQWKNQCTI